MLERIIAGIKRLIKKKEKREKELITRKILIQLLRKLDRKILNEAILHAAYFMIFAVFFKCGEFTYTVREMNSPSFERWHLIKKFIDIQADRMNIFLPASKIDLFRRGILLTVAAIGDEACAIVFMKNLFRRFSTNSNVSLFHQSGGAFTREFVIINLRAAMKQLGHQDNYSGHSFKRRAATSTKKAGLTDVDIQMLKRWKSDAYQLYIDKSSSYILHTSKRFQQPHHQSHP